MRSPGAFTLVELILVMALLCVILGLAAPSLSRSMRGRNLAQEGTRLVALTEYARDEAVSDGVPMEVWIDATSGHFGARAMPGYEDAGARAKEFTLIDGLHFEPLQNAVDIDGATDAAEFMPDGTLDPSSQPLVRILDQSNASVQIAQTTDGWGYEIAKATQ
jgi:type II secretion system protein H